MASLPREHSQFYTLEILKVFIELQFHAHIDKLLPWTSDHPVRFREGVR